jgi:hypothetical protein
LRNSGLKFHDCGDWWPISFLSSSKKLPRDQKFSARGDEDGHPYLSSLIHLRGRDPRVVGIFGVADVACDLGDRRVRSQTSFCGVNQAETKMLDKTEQSDRASNPNEKPESCYCSTLPKGSMCLPCYTRWLAGRRS